MRKLHIIAAAAALLVAAGAWAGQPGNNGNGQGGCGQGQSTNGCGTTAPPAGDPGNINNGGQGGNAAVVATAANGAGGQIKLTNEPCAGKLGADGALTMYATTPSGKLLYGCWALGDDGDVLVVYSNGEARMYDVADFEIKAPPAKKPAAKRHRSDL